MALITCATKQSQVFELAFCAAAALVTALPFASAKEELAEQWTTAPIIKSGEVVIEIKAVTHDNSPSTDVIVRIAGRAPTSDAVQIYQSATLAQTYYIKTPSTLDQLVNSDKTLLALPSWTTLFIQKLSPTPMRRYPDPTPTFQIHFDEEIERVEWSPSNADVMLVKSARGASFLVHRTEVEDYGQPVTKFETLPIPQLGKYKFFRGGFAYFNANNRNLNLNVVRCASSCVTSEIPVPAAISQITAFSFTPGNRHQGSVIDNAFLIFDETNGTSAMINSDSGRTLNTFQHCPTGCRFLAFDADTTRETAVNALVRENNGSFVLLDLFSGKRDAQYPNAQGYNLLDASFAYDQAFGATGRGFGRPGLWINFKTGDVQELASAQGIVRINHQATWLFAPVQPQQNSKIEIIPVLDMVVAQPQIATGIGLFQSAKYLGYKQGRSIVATNWYLNGTGSSCMVVWTNYGGADKDFQSSVVTGANGALAAYDDSDDGVYLITNDSRIKYLRFERIN